MLSNHSMPPAVILAGGEGKRLRPLTTTTPKPLLPMAGTPLLFHILHRLEGMGVEQAYVMIGYLGEKIEAALSRYDGKIKPICIREQEPLGSAGCFSLLSENDILQECFVVSGDAYFEFDLREALALRREKDAAAVLCLSRVESPLGFGLVDQNDDGRIRGFIEKPTWSRVQGDLANTGIYVLGKEALSFIRSGGTPLDFGADVFPALMKNGKSLYGIVGQGFWCDIGTPEAYRQCNLRLSGGKSVLGGGVKLASTAAIAGSVVFDSVQVGAGATLRDCIVCENAIVAEGAMICPEAVVGASAVIGERSLVGEGVTLPAGTIVAARSVLHAQFRAEKQARFENGCLYLSCREPSECGKRVGRAFAALAGKGKTIALLREQKRGQSDFVRALAEGILSGDVNLCDGGWGFVTEASFFAFSGQYAYTLYVEQSGEEIKLWIFDHNGLYPDARFERKFTDLIRELPKEGESSAEIYTEKQVKDRYLVSLRLLAGAKNGLSGMTVWVENAESAASQMLERALHAEGALLSQHADLRFALSEDGTRVKANVCGIDVGWWQIMMVLSLEQVKKGNTVLIPYSAPEAIKRAVTAAGGRGSYYTLYPENDSEKAIRQKLIRMQPWAVDGIAAAMSMAGLLASGALHAADLRRICDSLITGEEDITLDDRGKLRMITAHKQDFDGEGLLRRYRKGSVRVLAGAGDSMHLMAEAADIEDAKQLLDRIKKEIFSFDV